MSASNYSHPRFQQTLAKQVPSTTRCTNLMDRPRISPLQVFTAWLHGCFGPGAPAAVKIGGMHDGPDSVLPAGVRFSHEAYCLWLAAAAARTGPQAGASGNVVGLHGCLFAPPMEGIPVPVGIILEHCAGATFPVLHHSALCHAMLTSATRGCPTPALSPAGVSRCHEHVSLVLMALSCVS